MRRLFSVSLIGLLACGTVTICSAKTINVPQNYPTIQGAVDHASPGDTVKVHSGTYNENVFVFTNNIEIAGKPGAQLVGTLAPAVAGIDIFAANVTVSGLTIRNFDGGVAVHFGGGRITGNILYQCSFNGIYCNIAGDGINLPAPELVDHNTVYYNGNGIVLESCQNITVCQNLIVHNGNGAGGAGVVVSLFSDHCTVTRNRAFANGIGIFVDFFSTGNTFTYNIALGSDSFDAEDDSGGPNVWANNSFGPGKTIGF